MISDRHQQWWLVSTYRQALFEDDTGEFWTDLIENRQVQINTDDDDSRRRLVERPVSSATAVSTLEWSTVGSQWQRGM